QFPDLQTVDADLALMTRLGATTLRTFTVPPRWLLDLAAARGLRVLVGVPWAEHVCVLDSTKLTRDIRGTIAQALEACAGPTAVGGTASGQSHALRQRAGVRRLARRRVPRRAGGGRQDPRSRAAGRLRELPVH